MFICYQKINRKKLIHVIVIFQGLVCFHPSSAFGCPTMQQSIVNIFLKCKVQFNEFFFGKVALDFYGEMLRKFYSFLKKHFLKKKYRKAMNFIDFHLCLLMFDEYLCNKESIFLTTYTLK